MYGKIGGAAGCRKLAEEFYGRVDREPLLRPFFPGKNHRCAIEAFAAFLIQFLGGPADETQFRWYLSLRESHARFQIGIEHRDAWMTTMRQALRELEIDDTVRNSLGRFFEESSSYLVNRGSRPPAEACEGELSERWKTQRQLDDLLSAIRSGDENRALAIPDGLSPSVLAGVFRPMIRSGNSTLLEFVADKVKADPSLLRERYAHRTLLQEAAASGSASLVKLFLTLGAVPNALDDDGHSVLYSLANECASAGTSEIVRLLVAAGADVNLADGAKRCTPLHMAARRGHAETAAALLDRGANIEARDNLGHTPLRRAVNCGNTDVARLLVLSGADVHSRCRKGITPILAARKPVIRELLTAVSFQAAE